jgi:hypothetical protein
MTDNGIKNWCWKHFFISSSEAQVTGAREMQSRRKEENRGSLKSPVINWKLI